MNIAALLAGLFSGIAGSMGLGGGAVLIIYLSLFTDTDRITAGGINLIFFVPISLIAVIIYAIKKQIKWKTVIPFALFGLLGVVLGLWISSFLSARLLGKIFGGILIIMGLKQTLCKSVAKERRK